MNRYMFRVFRELGWFLKKEWLKYIIVIVFSLAITYGLTYPPKLIGGAIDFIASGSIDQTELTRIVGLLFVVAVVIYFAVLVKRYVLGSIFHKLFYLMKNLYLDKILKQDANFFGKYSSGDLMSRAMGDTHAIANVSTHIIVSIGDMVAMIVLSTIMMLQINPVLTLFAILPLPLIFLVVMIVRPKISANWKKVREKNGELNNLTMESVTHVKLIRSFVREEQDYKKLSDIADAEYKIERKSVLLQSIFGPTFRIITLISQGIALGFGSYLIINQQMSAGQLITFNIFLMQFAWPLFQLGNQITAFTQSGIAFDRFNEIIKAEPIVKDAIDSEVIKEFDSIEFRNLSFKYPDDTEYIIKGINLTINRGKTIGIVGKTGSGKSTLVKQLLRQFPVQEDEILIDGKSINSYKKESIREMIAYVPQEHTLFSRTVLENIELGQSKGSMKLATDAINMADFEKDIQYLPQGLQTMVGEYGVTLSGGQKQRLSIARAFIKDAEIMIFDDSLSAVDGTTEANIIKNLKKYRHGKTNIIIAHRMTAVEHCDEILVLEHGQIVERGSHETLMKNQGWYYEQYNAQLLEDVKDENNERGL